MTKNNELEAALKQYREETLKLIRLQQAYTELIREMHKLKMRYKNEMDKLLKELRSDSK